MIRLKIFGIDFGISVGFAGMLCLMLYIDRAGLMLPTLEATLVHELGHIIALCAFKCKPKRIDLKVGAVAVISIAQTSFIGEIIVDLSGSAVNFLFSAFFGATYMLFGSALLFNRTLVMLVIGCFNLLPIIGLDGGSIVVCLLGKRLKEKSVRRISFCLSIFCVMGILALGFMVFYETKSNPSMILLGLYLFLGVLLSKKQKNDCKILQNRVQ